MKIPYYHVDAFTDSLFKGNPAGVCLLDQWLPSALMQRIAAENKHAETAFVVSSATGRRVRWFSPTVEVDLCGHATLAAAFVLFEHGYAKEKKIQFDSKSGLLSVEKRATWLYLDFPVDAAQACAMPIGLERALGATPIETRRGKFFFLSVFDDEEKITSLRPDMTLLRTIEAPAHLVTAPTVDGNYVLRVFAPRVGIPEDPATGSAQCVLAPYWSEKLKKTTFDVRQLSERGGILKVEITKERVKIGGQAVLYINGSIEI